ncbi:MAG: aldo/keto reductase [Myxococcaceae bacterium]|nr:aldo/keto reductase [Myxococcaceae bacterium]
MNFGRRTPEAEARRIVDRALDQGVTDLDTANVYADGESERIVGRAVGARRDRVRVTTKVGAWRNEGLRADRVVASLDESLARLATDFVDVYLLHLPDPSTAFEATLEGVARVLESKKARAWGVSNFAAWQISELNHLCDACGVPRPAHSQVLYNVAVRQLELEYFAFTRRSPIETIVYNPLAGGLLARPPEEPTPKGARLEANALYRRRYGSETMRRFALRCDAIAKSAGLSLLQLSLAWVFEREGVDVVLLGPATEAHLAQALEASRVRLDPAVAQALDEAGRELTGTDASYAR